LEQKTERSTFNAQRSTFNVRTPSALWW